MQRCNLEVLSNKDRTSGGDDNRDDWDKELIRAVGLKVGRVEKDPEKVRLDRINVCLDEGANINVQDYKNGDTVLHVAIRKDYQKIVKLVLQRGARTDIANHKGDAVVRLAEITDEKGINYIFEGPVEQRSELQVCRSSTAGGSILAADHAQPFTSQGSYTMAVRRSTAHFHSSEREENINGSPGIVGSKTYPASDALTRSWSGIIYQWQYFEFTLHCAFQAGHKFDSATEMIEVGKLDDVVLLYKNHEGELVGRFVQLKYNDKCKISPNELFKDNGDYSVSDYLMSWLHIRGHKLFRDIQIINMILGTTGGLDVENLRLNQIYCDIAEDPDKTFELKSDIRETACYRFSANKETNKKLYHELRGCVSRKLAKRVVKCIYKTEIMKLEVDSFRDYHRALTEDVFIKNNHAKTYEFRQKFIKNDNLSPRVERFRRRFLFEYREMAKLPEKLYSEEFVWEDIKERFGKLAFRREFGESREVPKPCAESKLPDDIDDETISKFLEDFTLVTHLPGKIELDAIINRKIRDHNQCSEQRADQIGSAFRTKIQKFLSVKDNKGNEVDYLSHKVCKQLLDDMKHKVDSPNELLRKPVVKFQGHETCFGKLLDIRDSHYLRADELEDFVNMVDSRTLLRIILGEEIRIGEGLQGLSEIGNYYMNRTIYQHVVVRKDIFYDEPIPDLLAISGMDRGPMYNSVQMGNTSPALLRNLTNFTLLKYGQEEEQFRALCVKNPQRNIHWLKQKAGKYTWKRSQGDVTYLFKYRDSRESEDTNEGTDVIHLSECDLVAHCKPIIISDTAGTGKSTLLTYLAEKIKEAEPDLLVLQIDLIHHTVALDEIWRKKVSHHLGTINRAVQFLVNELLSHRADLDREVFKRIILKQRKIALIVDGFDEISPEHQDIVIDLLQALSDHGIKKLFVTTRRHTSEVLERKLNTFAYVITPLSAVNQEDLLIKLWTSKPGVHRDSEQKTESRARMTAKAIMNKLADLIGDHQNELTAIPFHTMMAGIFKHVVQNFIDLEIDQPKLFDNLVPNDVLQEFMAKKLELFYDEKCRPENRRASVRVMHMYRTDLRVLQRLWAMYALSGSDRVRLLLPLREDELEMLYILEKDFITHCIDDQPNRMCLWRSFAENIAAGFFREMLIHANWNTMKLEYKEKSARNILVSDILLRDDYKRLRTCIDNELRGMGCYVLKGCWSWKFYLNENRGELNETVLHVAAAENNSRIIELFLNCLRTNRQDQETLVNAKDNSGRTAVHWAVEHGHLDPIKLIVEYTDFEIDSQDSDGATPLYRAALGGKLSIVKYLLDKNANINSETKKGMTTLDAAILTNKCDVVEYLRLLIPGAIPNKLALETSVTK